jgi:hypothetical protein
MFFLNNYNVFAIYYSNHKISITIFDVNKRWQAKVDLPVIN